MMGGQRISSQRVAELVAHYRRHRSAAAAARSVECSTSAAIKHLRAAGIGVTSPPPPVRTVWVDFDSAAFFAAVDDARRERGVSWRTVLVEAGIKGASFITRFTGGQTPDANNLVRLLAWLGTTDMGPYMRSRGDA
jgi:hypothetical protein